MTLARVGIIGASGFSGLELTRLVLSHPRLELVFATSDRWVDQGVDSKVVAKARAARGLRYVGVDAAMALAKECAAVFLATPAETSLELVPRLLEARTRVVDLAGSFRLKDASQYPLFYKFQHTSQALLEDAVYGLPELFRSAIAGRRFVANPGCYPTAAALGLAPLLRAGLVELDSIVINAASGVSGAGRKSTEEYTFMEIHDDYRAYKVLAHQHTPEIEQTLSHQAKSPLSVVFTPHLLPMKRGILSTSTLRLKANTSDADVQAALVAAYEKEPLLRLKSGADAVRLAEVVDTPLCTVGATVMRRHCVVVSAIDNLLKGAASQAIQNLNLMLGFEEVLGLGVGEGVRAG
jgi:N-acetyl-gamma-glutamyl-phosphate reductase